MILRLVMLVLSALLVFVESVKLLQLFFMLLTCTLTFMLFQAQQRIYANNLIKLVPFINVCYALFMLLGVYFMSYLPAVSFFYFNENRNF